jgi:hypothetical protein
VVVVVVVAKVLGPWGLCNDVILWDEPGMVDGVITPPLFAAVFGSCAGWCRSDWRATRRMLRDLDDVWREMRNVAAIRCAVA